MYVCNGKQSQCKTFEYARQQGLRSRDASVRRAAGAFGDLSKKAGDKGDNGVNVTMVKKDNTSLGEVTAEKDTKGYTGSGKDARQATEVEINTKSNLQEAVAHEGTHVADRSDYVDTIRAGHPDSTKNILGIQSEGNAFEAQNALIEEGNRDRLMGGTGGASISGKALLQPLIDIPKMLGSPPYSNNESLRYPLFPE
jgi:hypothetical protein